MESRRFMVGQSASRFFKTCRSGFQPLTILMENKIKMLTVEQMV